MSKIHPPVCPVMSRAIHIPHSRHSDWRETNDYTVEAPCLQERCAWWISNEEMCAQKLLACAELDKIPLGGSQ